MKLRFPLLAEFRISLAAPQPAPLAD